MVKYQYSLEYSLMDDYGKIDFRENIAKDITEEELKKKIYKVIADYSSYVVYRIALYRYKNILMCDIGGFYDEFISIDLTGDSFNWFVGKVLETIKE